MTCYLKFPSLEEACEKLRSVGFVVGVYNDNVTRESDGAWGTLCYIPNVIGYHCNLWNCRCPQELLAYEIEAPTMPYNVRF